LEEFTVDRLSPTYSRAAGALEEFTVDLLAVVYK
jgi:hypothetical protein